MDKLELVIRAMAVFDGFDAPSSELGWRVDGEWAPVSLFANCNDTFFWGCADAEDITEENIEELEQAKADLLAVENNMAGLYVADLFACRVRKMRPQNAMYQHIDKALWPLFDACGPEREVDFGNPVDKPG